MLFRSGVLCGAGEYALAVLTAVLVLIILELNYLPVVRRFDARRQRHRGSPSPPDKG